MDAKTLKNANDWFQLQNIQSFIYKDSIYIVVGDGFEVELSQNEIKFRSNLLTEYKNTSTK